MLKKIIGIGSAVTVSILIAGCSENPTVSSAMSNATQEVATILNGTAEDIAIPDNPYCPIMMKSTNPSYPNNLEMVRRTIDDRIEHLWYDNAAQPRQWNSQTFFANNVISDPAICSNRNDNLLNVVVRQNEPGRFYKLTQWYRLEDENGQNWYEGDVFGSNVIGSPAMISNNVKVNGKHNLEVLALTGDNRLIHYTRDESTHSWSSQYLPALSANYMFVQSPVMAQNNNGDIVVAVYAIYGNYDYNYLVLFTKTATGIWNGPVYHPNYFDRNVRPSISTYGIGAQFSILFKYMDSNNLYEACTDRRCNFDPHVIWYNSNPIDNISSVDLCISQTMFYNFRTSGVTYSHKVITTMYY